MISHHLEMYLQTGKSANVHNGKQWGHFMRADNRQQKQSETSFIDSCIFFRIKGIMKNKIKGKKIQNMITEFKVLRDIFRREIRIFRLPNKIDVSH